MNAPAIDLTPVQADLLVSCQLRQAHPESLAPTAFHVAQIVNSDSISARIHAALTKSGILLPQPSTAADDALDGILIDTNKITRNFAHELFFVSAAAQKRIVALLFFWEDECKRRRGLEKEEAELNEALERQSHLAESNAAELLILRDAVRMKMRLLPSQRAEDTSNVGAGVGSEELPAYVQRET
ncbi:hypothetical protein MBLNU459_g7796t2 [Dothideomycetes sp. NU459]